MRKLTQKLVLSVVTMALVVIALGTSTFAWFTLTNSATVQAFDAQVTSGEGIEISLGDFTNEGNGTYTTTLSSTSNWYTVLSSTIINARIAAMYGSNLKLIDVTSEDGIVITSRDGSTTYTSLQGQYVQFDIYFRSSTTKNIRWNSVVLGGQTSAWTIDVPFIPANQNDASILRSSGAILTASRAAARVSITPVLGATLEDTVVYELDEILSADPVNNFTNSNALPVDSYATGAQFGAASYWIAKGNTAIDGSAVTLAATVKNLTTPEALLSLTNASLPSGFPAGYFYGKVTVRVWLEGWDADAYDSIFSRQLSVAIGFNAI